MYFKYGEKELNYLKKKDKKLATVIDKVVVVERKLEPDIFVCIVKNIVGQQISNKAFDTIWNRFINRVGKVTPENIYNTDLEGIGISAKKAIWIKDFSRKVLEKEFSIEALYEKSDNDAIKELCTLDGIGKWTAEMVLIFSMNRMDVLSYGDFGIKNGMKSKFDVEFIEEYNKKEITKDLFEKYRKRYSPYGSVASMYLWEVSGGCLNDKMEK